MSKPDTKTGLADLLEASHYMLACAQAGGWDAVASLQLQCDALAKDIISGAVTTSDKEACAAAIRELLDINDSILSLGSKAREACLDEAGTLKHGRQAINKYKANTG